MNRLPFRDFHQRHFGPEQQQYFQAFIEAQQQHQQQQPYDGYYGQQTEQQYGYYAQTDYYTQDGEPLEKEQDLPEAEDPISAETLKVMQFSENYKREREEEQRRLEEEEHRGEEDWPYDESRVLNSGLSEPPTSCLVLVNQNDSDKHSIAAKHIRWKEDLLNASYLAACRTRTTTTEEDAPIVLWPVLPFKV